MSLQDLRSEASLTQEEVCKRTGIPFNTYRRYEYGTRFPRPDAVIALAKLYALSPGGLFEALCREKGLVS